MKNTRHVEVLPCTVKRAQRWVRETHRRLKKIQGGMWAVRALYDGEMVGVAIVGNPARLLAEEGVLCVLRVAVREGYRNVCSALYAACARAARAMGATSLVTYTHEDEPGTSLRAAGWIDDGLDRWRRLGAPESRSATRALARTEATLVGTLECQNRPDPMKNSQPPSGAEFFELLQRFDPAEEIKALEEEQARLHAGCHHTHQLSQRISALKELRDLAPRYVRRWLGG